VFKLGLLREIGDYRYRNGYHDTALPDAGAKDPGSESDFSTLASPDFVSTGRINGLFTQVYR
jgi:hypothetical protein